MLTLILALAVRLVARVVGAAAARLSHFPAASLLGAAAGKIFSLPAGQGNWRNGLISRQNFNQTGSISERNRKFSLRFPVGRENRRWPGSMRGAFFRRRRSPADDRQYQCADDHDRRKGAAMIREDASL
jgi:hypothetical protein